MATTSSLDADASNNIKSELEKMLDGEPYAAFDPTLLQMRNNAKQLCFELNQTSPLDVAKRTQIIQQLLRVDDALVESPFYCDYACHLHVGRNFYANHGCTILDCAPITIGDNCLLAPHVVLSSAAHPLDVRERAAGQEFAKPIVIGNHVWIGANATVCQGVTIGNNVVIGAGAVVVKDVPDNTVVAGVPAKFIRTLEPEDTTMQAARQS
jgi:maltose O-acetyltransferase